MESAAFIIAALLALGWPLHILVRRLARRPAPRWAAGLLVLAAGLTAPVLVWRYPVQPGLGASPLTWPWPPRTPASSWSAPAWTWPTDASPTS